MCGTRPQIAVRYLSVVDAQSLEKIVHVVCSDKGILNDNAMVRVVVVVTGGGDFC